MAGYAAITESEYFGYVVWLVFLWQRKQAGNRCFINKLRKDVMYSVCMFGQAECGGVEKANAAAAAKSIRTESERVQARSLIRCKHVSRRVSVKDGQNSRNRFIIYIQKITRRQVNIPNEMEHEA